MISNSRVIIVGGAPAVKLVTSSGQSLFLVRSTGTGVFMGGSNAVTPLNGFRLSLDPVTLDLKNGDEIWVIATSTAVVSYVMQSPTPL